MTLPLSSCALEEGVPSAELPSTRRRRSARTSGHEGAGPELACCMIGSDAAPAAASPWISSATPLSARTMQLFRSSWPHLVTILWSGWRIRADRGLGVLPGRADPSDLGALLCRAALGRRPVSALADGHELRARQPDVLLLRPIPSTFRACFRPLSLPGRSGVAGDRAERFTRSGRFGIRRVRLASSSRGKKRRLGRGLGLHALAVSPGNRPSGSVCLWGVLGVGLVAPGACRRAPLHPGRQACGGATGFGVRAARHDPSAVDVAVFGVPVLYAVRHGTARTSEARRNAGRRRDVPGRMLGAIYLLPAMTTQALRFGSATVQATSRTRSTSCSPRAIGPAGKDASFRRLRICLSAAMNRAARITRVSCWAAIW